MTARIAIGNASRRPGRGKRPSSRLEPIAAARQTRSSAWRKNRTAIVAGSRAILSRPAVGMRGQAADHHENRHQRRDAEQRGPTTAPRHEVAETRKQRIEEGVEVTGP
jgi:hypothetical protein